MTQTIDYQKFIEDYFWIKDKHGVLMPFIFNDVQQRYYDDLMTTSPGLVGCRENLLKSRQFGISSLITAIFAVDFILSELGDIPIIDSDIYSHKDDATADHIARFNLFLNSFLVRSQGGDVTAMRDQEAIAKLRKAFLRVDQAGDIVSRKFGAQYHCQTASAKVSGRGGTKQNVHWSEVAFYPNTEIMNAKLLVTGAEEQVPDQAGKIFRETTGNMMGDFFADEYYSAKDELNDFHSRFYPWYFHGAYKRTAPVDWELPRYYEPVFKQDLASRDQCYWHWIKTKGLTDKVKLRENPTFDYEAFLLTGTSYFDSDSLIFHNSHIIKPVKEVMYVQAL